MNAASKVFRTIELLENIFYYLPWYDTYKFRLMSPEALYAFRTTVEEIDGEDFGEELGAKEISELFEALSVTGMRNLKKIDIRQQHQLSEAMEPILKFCPNLTQLAIKRTHLEEATSQDPLFFYLLYCENIKDLCIECSHQRFFTNSDMLELHMCMPHLTKLELVNCGITDMGLSEIADSNQHLIHLNVNGCEDITDRGVTDVLTGVPTLRELNVSDTWTMRIRPRTIKTYCENLRALNAVNTLLPEEYAAELQEWFSIRFDTFTFLHDKELKPKRILTSVYGAPYRTIEDINDDDATVYDEEDDDGESIDLDDLSISSASRSGSNASLSSSVREAVEEIISESEIEEYGKPGRSRFLLHLNDPEYEFERALQENKILKQQQGTSSSSNDNVDREKQWDDGSRDDVNWDDDDVGDHRDGKDDAESHSVDPQQHADNQQASDSDDATNTHHDAISEFHRSMMEQQYQSKYCISNSEDNFNDEMAFLLGRIPTMDEIFGKENSDNTYDIEICPGCCQTLDDIELTETCPGIQQMASVYCNPKCLQPELMSRLGPNFVIPMKGRRALCDDVNNFNYSTRRSYSNSNNTLSEPITQATSKTSVNGISYVERDGAVYYDLDAQSSTKSHVSMTRSETERYLQEELGKVLNEAERQYFLPKQHERMVSLGRRKKSRCCIN